MILSRGGRKCPAQVDREVSLGTASGDGIPKDLADVLFCSMRRLVFAASFNRAQAAKTSAGVILLIGRDPM